MSVRWVGIAGLLLAATSCDVLYFSFNSCAGQERTSMVVEIRHALTSAPLADSATVWVTDGSFSDTLQLCGLTSGSQGVSRCGPVERPGTYSVRVTRAGYQPWSQSSVRVTEHECHGATVTLQVWLQPAS